MKITIETITPAKAAAYLQTVDTSKQRPLKQGKIDDYACAMSHGHWVLTHQGIAFDDAGNLCDGQHRLHAVVKSGATIVTQVTRNLEQKQNDLFTFDAIDQGVKRHIGEQLHVRHGVENATSVAGACKKIAQLCAKRNPVMSVANTIAIYGYYQKEITECIRLLRPTTGMTKVSILGPAAFCMRPGGEIVRKFVEAVGNGEGLKKGNPALTFRQYALNNRERDHGGIRTSTEIAFCVAAMNAVLGKEIKRITLSHRGIDFFADQQPRVVKEIRGLFTV